MKIDILDGKRIVLGVTGSIACYKSADLASKLTQSGALVDVVLTTAATRFVTPLTFQSVTGRRVYGKLWEDEAHVPHVALGESAEILIIAPATAHTIAKLAHGLADNLLAVTALAARCPLVIVPAMDGGMYSHPAVRANLAQLQARGALVLGPAEGRMASGLVGKGRMIEPAEIVGHVRQILGREGALAGQRVLITAGPTEEALDPVRFLTNRSSGKQGVALAQAAIDRGARVTLIHGPILQSLPVGVAGVSVRSAREMCAAVLDCVGGHDLLIMAAAVGDFRPKTTATHKIKKDPNSAAAPTIELTRNPDILGAVKAWRQDNPDHALYVVGFAAETENFLQNGADKLRRKGLDLIAVNNVGGTETGFGVDTNQVTLVGTQGMVETIPLQSKAQIAGRILAVVGEKR